MSPRCDTREDENSAEARARARGEAGAGNCVRGGRVGKVGIRCVGDAEASPGFATYGLCESGSYSSFQESTLNTRLSAQQKCGLSALSRISPSL